MQKHGDRATGSLWTQCGSSVDWLGLQVWRDHSEFWMGQIGWTEHTDYRELFSCQWEARRASCREGSCPCSVWGVPLAPSSTSKWRLNTHPSLLKNLLGIPLLDETRTPKKERIKATIEKILVACGWEIHFLVMLKVVAYGLQYMSVVHTWLDVCNHFLLGISENSYSSSWNKYVSFLSSIPIHHTRARIWELDALSGAAKIFLRGVGSRKEKKKKKDPKQLLVYRLLADFLPTGMRAFGVVVCIKIPWQTVRGFDKWGQTGGTHLALPSQVGDAVSVWSCHDGWDALAGEWRWKETR